MAIDKPLTLVILGWVLLSAGLQGLAEEGEPCAPFLNGKVDLTDVTLFLAGARRVCPGFELAGHECHVISFRPAEIEDRMQAADRQHDDRQD